MAKRRTFLKWLLFRKDELIPTILIFIATTLGIHHFFKAEIWFEGYIEHDIAVFMAMIALFGAPIAMIIRLIKLYKKSN
jgi:hypothetical protein